MVPSEASMLSFSMEKWSRLRLFAMFHETSQLYIIIVNVHILLSLYTRARINARYIFNVLYIDSIPYFALSKGILTQINHRLYSQHFMYTRVAAIYFYYYMHHNNYFKMRNIFLFPHGTISKFDARLEQLSFYIG